MLSSVGVALMLASLGAAVRPEGEVVALAVRGVYLVELPAGVRFVVNEMLILG